MPLPRIPGSLRTWWHRQFGAGRPGRRRSGRTSHGLTHELLESRLAPTVSFSISDPAPFPEGDSGTSNVMFVVTRSGDTAPAVQADFKTQDGTGTNGAHAGTDYVATSGTLQFAPNQTTATIAVPVIGNTIFQSNRTFGVVLSNPLASADFADHRAFATGNGPYSVAVGDVNGDGKPDLVVANRSSNTVSVLLNTTAPGATTPSFADQQTFATGSSPQSVAVGDVNGDGKLDLVVANRSSNTVSVLLNTTAPGATTPSFATQQTFATGSTPFSAAVGDVNGDGRPDIVVANYGSNTVSVLLNTTAPGATTPSFAAQQTFPAGTRPDAVALGDVNGDGKPDIVVANPNAPGNPTGVSVLLNTTAAGSATSYDRKLWMNS
jgi:predicted nucleotidyltransferase